MATVYEVNVATGETIIRDETTQEEAARLARELTAKQLAALDQMREINSKRNPYDVFSTGVNEQWQLALKPPWQVM